jgi:HSP20 family protein
MLGFLSADVLSQMEDDDEAALRRGWWVSKEDDNAVELKMAMPGLAKEHVKVWADQDGGLMIKGEGTEDDDEEDYNSYIELPSDAFKMDQIKAEMKDGLLKLTVPKIKFEDSKDVFQVKVE